MESVNSVSAKNGFTIPLDLFSPLTLIDLLVFCDVQKVHYKKDNDHIVFEDIEDWPFVRSLISVQGLQNVG